MTALRDALDACCNGFSADRVVADPDLNKQFVVQCRNRGLSDTVAELNWSLLNLRKRAGLSGRKRAKRTHFPNEGDYRFAAEMAARFLERRDGVSLDGIICDPDRVAEFDELANQINPGYTSLQYRWAALNLRKAKKFEPEILARVAPPTHVESIRVDQIDSIQLPTNQGLYQFFTAEESLYVGEAENLRTRLKKHLDHSDNQGLARWMWEFGTDDLHLELQTLENSTTSRVRKALELELIRSREPVFNIQR